METLIRPRPLYIMAKPPADKAMEIDELRRALGIENAYARDRFHTTILPLCDARVAPPGLVHDLHAVFASLSAERCTVFFDRLHRNALRGGKALRGLCELQRMVVTRLTAMGIRLPAHRFRPHLSLAYGPSPERTVTIPPVSWEIDELLLIKSIHGESRHEMLARFPLIARQTSFDF